MTARPARRRTTRLLPVVVPVLVLALSGCAAEEPEPRAEADRTAASDSSASAGESPADPAEEVTLSVDTAAAAGKCMVPTAEALATQTTAFEGTVTALEDGTATLEVDRWYAGEEAEQVTVAAPDEDLQALILAVDFEVGRTYLVSATDGQVSLCGFSAEKTPELEALYAEAFGA